MGQVIELKKYFKNVLNWQRIENRSTMNGKNPEKTVNHIDTVLCWIDEVELSSKTTGKVTKTLKIKKSINS